MRVLGIDPGSICTGYAVVETREHKRVCVVVNGEIRLGHDPLAIRLARIVDTLEEVIFTHKPNAIAVEEVFHFRNPKSVITLSHARGAALAAAGRAHIDVYEYSPRRVKQTITGYGGATKHGVQKMLRATLDNVPESIDASDALAIALCHVRWCAS